MGVHRGLTPRLIQTGSPLHVVPIQSTKSYRRHSHYSELDRSEIDLSQISDVNGEARMRTEIDLNESEIDLNECEHFPKVV